MLDVFVELDITEMKANQFQMLFTSANSFVFPQWIRGGGRGGGPRLSPPECLSDPLLGRHLYVKIRVSLM